MTVVHTTIALVLFTFIFVRALASVVYSEPLRFRIADLIVLTTAVAVLSAAGFAFDALVVCLVILYTITIGRLWRRRGRSLAFILGTLLGVLTIIAVVAQAIAPLTAWKSVAFYLTLFPSLYVSFMFLIGDNATSELQLILLGLPFGLPLNILIGFVLGAVLERSITAWRGPQPVRPTQPTS